MCYRVPKYCFRGVVSKQELTSDVRVTVSVCLHGIGSCGTSRRGHDFLWHLRREAEARHPLLMLARSLFQRLFLLFRPLFWTAVEAGWQATVGGSTASTVFLEIPVASQGNRPAHVTLKALDWLSISRASWYPPKMTQRASDPGCKAKCLFSDLDKSDLSACRSGDEDGSLRITGLLEWIWERRSR